MGIERRRGEDGAHEDLEHACVAPTASVRHDQIHRVQHTP
jgi:hypothetical protein